jgi:hypothetical protein
MSVTVADLKKEIAAYNYDLLTGEDDTVAERAIQKAVIWAKAKVTAASGYFDEESEVNRQIVIKRTLYELYSYAENEAVAQDKKEDAMELLRAVYGDAVDSAGYQGGSETRPLPAGHVVSGPRPRSLGDLGRYGDEA